MVTKLQRYTVSVPEHLLPVLTHDVKKRKVKVASWIISILEAHYQSYGQAPVFGHPSRSSAELVADDVPVFGRQMADQTLPLAAEPPLARRAAHG